jgi:hypothetical protein
MPKMKAYASFDDYLKDQSPKNQAIIRALRRFVKRVQPRLDEAVKWGNGCWVSKGGPVAYVFSCEAYVQFGFFRGASLKDPKGLLEGKGAYVRHTKVRSKSEIDELEFAALLKQAVAEASL